MAKRSPILGFNHNFRHRGLVFHVQTEDSGVDNPHIFTHLFKGGVILSSRKLTYDVGSAEEVVKALMQAQHKAMLKDLKRGTFNAKIDDYLGDDPDLEPLSGDTLADISDTSPSARAPTVIDSHGPDREVDLEIDLEVILEPAEEARSAALAEELEELLDDDDLEIEIIGGPSDTLRNAPAVVVERESTAPIEIEAEPSSPIPSAGAYAQHRTGSYERVPESGPRKPRTGTSPRIKTPRTGSRPPGLPPQAIEIAAELEATAPIAEPEVVVSRPSVIVGAPPKVVGGKQPAPRRAREGSSSLFGKDLISEKSLDEVILAYLSEDGSSRDG